MSAQGRISCYTFRGLAQVPRRWFTLATLRVLLITPPMTQINTPYPATAYLMGFLRLHEARLDLQASQADVALELFLKLYSRTGLRRVLDALGQPTARGARKPSVGAFVERGADYVGTVEAAVRFL